MDASGWLRHQPKMVTAKSSTGEGEGEGQGKEGTCFFEGNELLFAIEFICSLQAVKAFCRPPLDGIFLSYNKTLTHRKVYANFCRTNPLERNMARPTNAPHPGRILNDLFVTTARISITALAQDLHLCPQRLYNIVRERQSITPETATRLGRYFGTPTAKDWMALQAAYELDQFDEEKGERVRMEVRPRASLPHRVNLPDIENWEDPPKKKLGRPRKNPDDSVLPMEYRVLTPSETTEMINRMSSRQ